MSIDKIEQEMPKYNCNKQVWALKIAKIKCDNEDNPAAESDGSAIITPADETYSPFKVDAKYMHKHKPEVNGYYVIYKDGYKSFSPAEPFEEGYSLET